MSIKRAALAVVGGALLLAGLALLVLPGPGLLLVLGGLALLARAFPALERHVEPVRRRAMQSAEDSVASPLRVTGAVLTGLGLVAAGVAWIMVPGLPSGGWSTGSALIVSGLVLFALLGYSYRRARARGPRRGAAASRAHR